MFATSKDRKRSEFELRFAELIINVRIGKETESSNILVEQELPRPFSLLQLLTGSFPVPRNGNGEHIVPPASRKAIPPTLIWCTICSRSKGCSCYSQGVLVCGASLPCLLAMLSFSCQGSLFPAAISLLGVLLQFYTLLPHGLGAFLLPVPYGLLGLHTYHWTLRTQKNTTDQSVMNLSREDLQSGTCYV